MVLTEKVLNREFSINPSKEEIDSLVSDLTGVIVNPAKQTGLCKKNISKKVKPRKSPRQSWFSSECEAKRKRFFMAKNSVKKAKTREEKSHFLAEMDRESKEYKLFISTFLVKTINPKISHFDSYLSRFKKNNFQKLTFLFCIFFLFTTF